MSGIQARDRGIRTGLQMYLDDLKDDVLLTAAEECALAAAIARGDQGAKRRLIEANLRLVVKIARDYIGRGIAIDDLIGEGNLGLIRATEEYDPRFGTRFSTYASYWIKQSIRHALINTTATIRLPAHMVGLLTKWRRMERSLCRELRRAPTFDETADALELSPMQRTLVARAMRARQLRLENTMASDEARWSPDESVGHGDAPDSALESEDDRVQLYRRMDRLDERERAVIALRYGLGGSNPLTLKEIGRRLGVTREWVRKIELRAVRKLDDKEPEVTRRSTRRMPRRAMMPAPLEAAGRKRPAAQPLLAAASG